MFQYNAVILFFICLYTMQHKIQSKWPYKGNTARVSKVKPLPNHSTTTHLHFLTPIYLFMYALVLTIDELCKFNFIAVRWNVIIYKRYKTRKWHLGPFTILQKLYLSSILHLTLIHCNSLTINVLISVRYYKFYLHATYTPHILPHGTSTGEWYHNIGEQKCLSLRQISLRPYGV